MGQPGGRGGAPQSTGVPPAAEGAVSPSGPQGHRALLCREHHRTAPATLPRAAAWALTQHRAFGWARSLARPVREGFEWRPHLADTLTLARMLGH